MKTKTTVLISILLLFCFAVRLNGQITLERKGLKTTFYKDGQVKDAKSVGAVLSSDQASAKTFSNSKTLGYVSTGMWAAAAVCEGAALVYTLKENQALNEGDWDAQSDYESKSLGSMLIGVGFMLAAVPVGLLSHSQFKKSISLYNTAHTSAALNDMTLSIGFIGSGVGVELKF